MATKARLHWFWRGAIAVVVGTGLALLMWTVPLPGYLWLVDHAESMVDALHVRLHTGRAEGIRMVAFYVFPAILVAVAAYGFLTGWFGPPTPDGETHCRRCNHILRGLSEPRCPECGQAI